MANELTISSLNIRYTKGTGSSKITKTIQLPRTQITVAGDNVTDLVQTVGTSEEVVDLAEAGVGGFMIVHNLDTTNFIEVRANTGVADTTQVKAGEWQIFRIATDAVPYVIADTAACDCRFIIFPA